MKLVRFGEAGQERPGLIDGQGIVRDLSSVIADIDGSTLSPEGLARLQRLDPALLPPVAAGVRLGMPLVGVGKIVGIGLNYADHAAEAGKAIPDEPIVFLKASSSLTGPDDPIILPPGSTKTDWEVELVVVIGVPACRISEADAAKHIAGYCIGLDLSERYWQLERGGQWTKGKSFDTFAPIGPWIATADESPRIEQRAMTLLLNGEMRQNSSTEHMLVKVAQLVSYVSQVMSLQAGDLIFTGTPAGVGMGCRPPRYLKTGDRLMAAIEGLGEQRHEVGSVSGLS